MIQKTITFTGFDGKQITKEYWFHLSKAEIAEMTILFPGESLADHLQTIASEQNPKMLLQAFKDILSRAVGERTPEGRFVKSREFQEEFMASDAYSELFMELIGDAKYAAEFINSIVPAELTKGAPKKEYTTEELLAMDDAQFDAVAGTDIRAMTREHLAIAMQRKTREPA